VQQAGANHFLDARLGQLPRGGRGELGAPEGAGLGQPGVEGFAGESQCPRRADGLMRHEEFAGGALPGCQQQGNFLGRQGRAIEPAHGEDAAGIGEGAETVRGIEGPGGQLGRNGRGQGGHDRAEERVMGRLAPVDRRDATVEHHLLGRVQFRVRPALFLLGLSRGEHVAVAVGIGHQIIRAAQRRGDQRGALGRGEEGEFVAHRAVVNPPVQDGQAAVVEAAADVISLPPAAAVFNGIGGGLGGHLGQAHIVAGALRLEGLQALVDAEEAHVPAEAQPSVCAPAAGGGGSSGEAGFGRGGDLLEGGLRGPGPEGGHDFVIGAGVSGGRDEQVIVGQIDGKLGRDLREAKGEAPRGGGDGDQRGQAAGRLVGLDGQIEPCGLAGRQCEPPVWCQHRGCGDQGAAIHLHPAGGAGVFPEDGDTTGRGKGRGACEEEQQGERPANG
jgi:hypothetical protein